MTEWQAYFVVIPIYDEELGIWRCGASVDNNDKAVATNFKSIHRITETE